MSNAAGSFRLPAGVALVGLVLYILVTQLHAGGDANDHHAIFEAYAHNSIWGAVHLGQFLAMGIIAVGLLGLFLSPPLRGGKLLASAGAAGVAVSLALYAALQAVDGVALKQAVNALATSPAEEHAARFASAEVVRWLEWGMRSYHDLAFGLTLLLLAALFIRTAQLARPIGWLAGASGIAYLAQGWIAGTEGFTPAQSAAIVLGWALNLAWMIWLSVPQAGRRQTS
jgi:hypothetical protein